MIGSLIGITVAAALGQVRTLTIAIGWQQIVSVLGSLLISPVLGFVLALGLYKLFMSRCTTSARTKRHKMAGPRRYGSAACFY